MPTANCSIVIPCYNEASRLKQDEFLRYLTASPQVSLVFVNDGSTDHTVEILESLKAGMPAQIDVLDKKGRIFATCASLVLNLPVYDTQCGAKLFRVTPEIQKLFGEPFSSRGYSMWSSWLAM